MLGKKNIPDILLIVLTLVTLSFTILKISSKYIFRTPLSNYEVKYISFAGNKTITTTAPEKKILLHEEFYKASNDIEILPGYALILKAWDSLSNMIINLNPTLKGVFNNAVRFRILSVFTLSLSIFFYT